MSDAAENATQDAANASQTEARPGNYRQRAVQELNQPAPEKKERETKQERKQRERLEAVATIKERAARDNGLVLEARARFDAAETEARQVGRPVTYPYSKDTAERVLRYVAQAVPVADYAEFPGAPERPGACTLAGIPSWAFYRWLEGENGAEGVSEILRAGLARARLTAADTLADRHLHLAQVALEVPWASDAVRVAADILRWQASIRNRDAYGEQNKPNPLAGREIHIHIGTEAPPQPRVVDGEVIAVQQQPALQAPDATG